MIRTFNIFKDKLLNILNILNSTLNILNNIFNIINNNILSKINMKLKALNIIKDLILLNKLNIFNMVNIIIMVKILNIYNMVNLLMVNKMLKDIMVVKELMNSSNIYKNNKIIKVGYGNRNFMKYIVDLNFLFKNLKLLFRKFI